VIALGGCGPDPARGPTEWPGILTATGADRDCDLLAAMKIEAARR